MSSTSPNCTQCSMLLGWSAGLWTVWSVLNWFPFVETGSPMILPVAGAVLVLFIGGLVVDLPSATPDRVVAVVFIGLILWSTWLLHSGSSSIGLSLAAIAGLLAYWQQLNRLSQQADCSMLKRPHVMPWLFWAAMLEGLWLMMPVTVCLPAGEALGMVLVVGFLWMLASVFGAPSGHYAYETSLPEVKAPTPIIGVFFIPWGIGVLSMVLGAALGQTGVWVAWGYVAASLVSAWAALGSRWCLLQQLASQATQEVPPP